MKPTSYSIPANVRDELVQYLSARPYREVAGAIAALMNLAPDQGKKQRAKAEEKAAA